MLYAPADYFDIIKLYKNMQTNNKGNLEEFSQSLIKLGKEIESKLAEKKRLEEENDKKEDQVRKLQSEIFASEIRLAKLSTELIRLEKQRGQLEEQESTFGGMMGTPKKNE